MSRKAFAIPVLILIALLAACPNPADFGDPQDGDPQNGGPDNGRVSIELKNLDIRGAAALAIVPSKAAARDIGGDGGTDGDAETSSRLVKISAEGAIVEVVGTDADGQTVAQSSSFAPRSVTRVNDAYVIITIAIASAGNEGSSDDAVPYLIRTSDGAVFSMENVGEVEKNNYFLGCEDVYTVGEHVMYFLVKDESYRNAIWRLDATDPDDLKVSRVSYADDNVSGFAIVGSENLLYTTEEPKNRLKVSATGAYHVIQGDQYWLGLDGSVYAARSTTGDDTPINKLALSADGTLSWSEHKTIERVHYSRFFLQYYLVRASSKVIRIEKEASSYYPQYVELDNAAGEPSTVGLAIPKMKIQDAVASGDRLIVAGTDSDTKTLRILSISLADYEYSDLIATGTFDSMYSMMVDVAGAVTFSAMRLSDGRKVVASVTQAGALTILDESLNVEIKSLTRIQ